MTTMINGWIDLSARAKFRLSGPDRVRYLNGQVTNNVARLRLGETCQALVCNHKGRLEGELFIKAEQEALLMDAPGALRESLFKRLGKYLIADDCELEDVTDEFHLWHEILPENTRGDVWVDRLGLPGRDVWKPVGGGGGAPPVFLTFNVVEVWRVTKGFPQWGAELTTEVFPQEARMEGRAVDFNKGCYVGQEIVSRLRSVGQVNRLLQGLESLEEEPGGLKMLPSVGSPLITEAGRSVGVLTSVVCPPEGRRLLALGYVKRSFVQPGAIFQTPADGPIPARSWRLRAISLV